MWWSSRLLVIALWLASSAGPARAADPDDFDPILDGTPDQPVRQRGGGAGAGGPGARFVMSGYAGVYLGSVRSRLEDRFSTLEGASRAAIGFGFGVRTPSLIELGFELALGLGQTLDVDTGATTYAFDLLVEPRILAHVLEGDEYGLYAGLGGLLMLFDVEAEGLNQAGMGPALVVGGQLRLDRHSRFYLEASGTPFYDFLAFHYEAPSEKELEEDPAAEDKRVDGAWFQIYRVTTGYRLDF
jgi:hypothetical protein